MSERAGLHPRHATPEQQLKVDMAMVAYRVDSALQWLPRFKNPGRILLSALGLSGGTVAAQEVYNISTNSNVGVVQAADCLVKRFDIDGYRFSDNPVIGNTFGLADPVDFIIGESPKFGSVTVAVEDKTQPNSRLDLDTKDMADAGDHATATFTNLRIPQANTILGKGERVKIKFRFGNDPLRQRENPELAPEGEAIVGCLGGEGGGYGGILAAKGAVETTAQNAKGLNTIGAREDELAEQRYGKGRKPNLTPAWNNLTANLKTFKDNLAKVLTHSAEVRAKEKAQVLPAKPAKKPAETTPVAPEKGGKGKNIQPAEAGDATLAMAVQDLIQEAGTRPAILITGVGGLFMAGAIALWRRIKH